MNMADLEILVDSVMRVHELRKDRCETLPLIRKRKHRPRPKTAIISEAAKALMKRRCARAQNGYT